MQVLTPSGYRDAYSLEFGDEVCAFDQVTGAPIVNTLESKPQWVDATEWARWWSVEDEVPPFRFLRVNGTWLLNSEQSIWRNGTNVCHARDLVVGDVIYDDADHDVLITSLAEEGALGWWRFDVSGDHSYITDGLTVHNASRFWVGGTGTWDSSTTTNWAATTGGAGGASVPGSADNVFLDGSSGGGTVTVNFGGAITISSVNLGAFTGTFDNSVNNNNFSMSFNGVSFTGSGTGTRVIKLGSATYTLTSSAAQLTFATTTGLTFTGSSSTISFTGSGAQRSFLGGALTWGTVSFGAVTGVGSSKITGPITFTITTLNVTAPNYVIVDASGSNALKVTGALNASGSSTNQIGFVSSMFATQVPITVTGATINMQWVSFRDTIWTGSPTATNSFDLGSNTGITITAPSGGAGASSGVIGS